MPKQKYTKQNRLDAIRALRSGALPPDQRDAAMASLHPVQQINLSHDFTCECGHDPQHPSDGDNLEWINLDDQRQLREAATGLRPNQKIRIVNEHCPNLRAHTFIVLMRSEHLMMGYYQSDLTKGGDA